MILILLEPYCSILESRISIIVADVYYYLLFCSEAVCKEDWLEIYNMFRDHTEKKIGRYCGVSAPGPLESAHGAVGLKILFRTDEKDVYSGFKARYAFQSVKPIFGGKRMG